MLSNIATDVTTNMKKRLTLLAAVLLPFLQPAEAADKPIIEYPYAPYSEGRMDPQLTGWPLTDAERAFVKKPIDQRRPGKESGKNLPEMWSVTPTAGYISWSAETDTVWLGKHTRLRTSAQENPDTKIVLLGDAFTERWGGGVERKPLIAAWQKQFARHKTLNFGIAAERTENLLWRLDHGALDGLSPKVVVLNIGMNNVAGMDKTGVTIASIAQGIQLSVRNIRARVPAAHVVLVKLLPAAKPGSPVRESITKVNAALDGLHLDKDPMVQVLDLMSDLTHQDGALRDEAYAYDQMYLGDYGYEIYAAKLRPLIEKALNGN